ncbi:MerR family transcriptional regulator [Nocardiopsis changdeensis]|uniref:MerR family transcriptional regulator n=1 Tax=Nocardiopsis changdeensis TaxID=2831969 RepID=A0ABX8BLB8_9ACTN|nr:MULTISPECIES: MerR family transcriptional regulator [Nocardiopsis]QUX22812.1 MerR family transcriptional regulator [Nocardiopsis changdeensis]QYX38754.1 MerR family transcriptional regulator [Nocardiopsis sp. MT53]
MLSIKDFSEMCRLSPQTLRFYHAEGLLVPAEVDERTGYRGYEFAQIETAMTVMALRGAGMSVKLVRRALDEPASAADLLREHTEELRLKRAAEDDAIATARELLTARPTVRRGTAPGRAVVTAVAPDPESPPTELEDDVWGPTMTSVAATARGLAALVEEHGGRVAGPAWASMTLETEEQLHRYHSAEGPVWRVDVPVAGDTAALAEHAEVRAFESREELSVFLPGAQSMAKYGTALSMLASHRVEGMIIDMSAIRLVLHDDGVETAVRLAPLADYLEEGVPA